MLLVDTWNTVALFNYHIICGVFFLLIDTADTKGNSTGQHTPFEFVDPSDLDCSLCMRYSLFSCGCLQLLSCYLFPFCDLVKVSERFPLTTH